MLCLLRRFWILMLMVLAAAPAAGQGFEGVVRQRVMIVPGPALATLTRSGTDPVDPDQAFALTPERILAAPAAGPGQGVQVIELTSRMKGTRTRGEIKLGGALAALAGGMIPEMYTIVDRGSGNASIVLPAMRMYMQMPADANMIQQLTGIEQMAAQLGNLGEPRVRPLGNQTVNGFAAEGYEIRLGEQVVIRGWTAPALKELNPPAAANAGGPVEVLVQRGYPVRLQLFDQRGTAVPGLAAAGPTYIVFEALAVERGSVPDDMFVVPSGFQAIDPANFPMMPNPGGE